MFKRFMNLVKGSANKGMKKLETPELMAEEAQMELEKAAKDLKEATIDARTNEKMLEKKVEAASKKIEEWKARAALAVQQKNDDIARQCLQKKKEMEVELESLNMQLEEQKRISLSMNDRRIQVERELSEFKLKKQQLIARMQAGDALADAKSIGDVSSVTSGIDQFEEKIREQEMRNEVLRELDEDTLLEDEFKKLESSQGVSAAPSAVDDELAQLKQKLLEDKSSE
ncbi:MAG: PspA/IM30 family protein [Cyanobacteriota/Melainabacteria group bacterium]|nr:PspA/IM30 family protein [Candidatus Obscuribacterales bacterium]